MTYKQFKRKEKYVYYFPLFNEIVLGAFKHETGLVLHIGSKKTSIKLKLEYVGEL